MSPAESVTQVPLGLPFSRVRSSMCETAEMAASARALRGFKAIKDAFFAHSAKDGEEFNFVETKDEFGVKRLYISSDRAIRGKRYLVDPELIQLVRTATTDSGETDTAKWMTGAEKERK